MSMMREFQLLCDTPECHETVPRTGQCGHCRRDAEEAREAGLGEILDNHVWQYYQAVSPGGFPLSVEAHDFMSRYNRTQAQARETVPQEEPLRPVATANTAAPLAAYVQRAKERMECGMDLIDEVLARHEEVA